MSDSNRTPTRKKGRHLRVPVLPNEESKIKNNALKAGISIAEYLRRVGIGYQIQSSLDKDHIIELSKINADLGRLGGLLKLWLIDDKRIAHFDHKKIIALLNHIKATQNAMFNVVKKL